MCSTVPLSVSSPTHNPSFPPPSLPTLLARRPHSPTTIGAEGQGLSPQKLRCDYPFLGPDCDVRLHRPEKCQLPVPLRGLTGTSLPSCASRLALPVLLYGLWRRRSIGGFIFNSGPRGCSILSHETSASTGHCSYTVTHVVCVYIGLVRAGARLRHRSPWPEGRCVSSITPRPCFVWKVAPGHCAQPARSHGGQGRE